MHQSNKKSNKELNEMRLFYLIIKKITVASKPLSIYSDNENVKGYKVSHLIKGDKLAVDKASLYICIFILLKNSK